jgi:hypothetical protein
MQKKINKEKQKKNSRLRSVLPLMLMFYFLCMICQLHHRRSLLPYSRSLLPYSRSLLPYSRSLLPLFCLTVGDREADDALCRTHMHAHMHTHTHTHTHTHSYRRLGAREFVAKIEEDNEASINMFLQVFPFFFLYEEGNEAFLNVVLLLCSWSCSCVRGPAVTSNVIWDDVTDDVTYPYDDVTYPYDDVT